MAKVNIRGVLIPNSYKEFYDWYGEENTCPADVQAVLDTDPDALEVYINSPGGVIDVGSEIYAMLRAAPCDVKIYITGQACSAASVIACASYCEMAPTAMMMVHCVSTMTEGNHNAMEHAAEVLRAADRAMCTAYTEKSGMTEEEALEMMEHETWLTAQEALRRGLIDGIMFALTAGPLFTLPTAEQLAEVREAVNRKKRAECRLRILERSQNHD